MREPLDEKFEAARRDGFDGGQGRVQERTPDCISTATDQKPLQCFIPLQPELYFGELYRTSKGWLLEVWGRRVELTTSQLMAGPRSLAFRVRVLNTANVIPPTMTRTEWEALVRARLAAFCARSKR